MQRRLAVRDRCYQFVYHLAARHRRIRQGFDRLRRVVVDLDAVWRRSQVGQITTHDHRAEMLVGQRVGCRLRSVVERAAIVARSLERAFLRRVVHASKPLARGAVILRRLCLAHFADSVHQRVAVEVPITAVGRTGEGTAAESQQRLIGAFGGTLGIPIAGMRKHGLHQAAAEQTQDVDLVRRLAVDDAATDCGVKLFGPARAVQKIGEVQRRQHAHRAKPPALDHCERAQHRQIEAVAVPDHHLHAGGCHRIHHAGALRQRDGQRLFH